MMPEGLRTAAELAADKPHGTRIKYMGGCRCIPCRAANSRYSVECDRRKRRGEGNPLVPADGARAHLRKLSKAGVGYKTVADAAGVAASVVAKITAGQRTRIRKRTADRILAVTPGCAADGALVPAGPTWKRIRWLLDEGFTMSWLARRLGSRAKVPALQIGKKRVKASTALRVEKLVNLLRAGE